MRRSRSTISCSTACTAPRPAPRWLAIHLRPRRWPRYASSSAIGSSRKLFLWQKERDDIRKEMDSELQMPGWGNVWTQPIINRVNMLATGVRTPVGVKGVRTHGQAAPPRPSPRSSGSANSSRIV